MAAFCKRHYKITAYPIDKAAKLKYDLYNKLYFAKGDVVMNKPHGKYAWTATVGEKGQIVIPKQARELFGIKPGDTLVLLGDEKRGIAIPPKTLFSQLAAAVFEPEEEASDDGAL
jgi:AbrB family looped-hinge helix DNA binding protein